MSTDPALNAQVRRVGTRIAEATGRTDYRHPQAARDLWVRMASRRGARQHEFLSTHPLPQTRIAQIEAWVPEAMQHHQPR